MSGFFERDGVDGAFVGPLCGGDKEDLAVLIMKLDVVVIVVVGKGGGRGKVMFVDGGHGGWGCKAQANVTALITAMSAEYEVNPPFLPHFPV